MKNYRKWIPLLLIVFVLMSIYSRVTELQKQEAIYYGYLQQAREYREGKIYIDAMEQYQNALDMKNTLQICEEVGEMLLEKDKKSQIEDWGDYMIQTYPKEVAGYEYLINFHLSQDKYKECFDLYDTVKKRSLYSETLADTMDSIRYVYELKNCNYSYVSEYSCSYCYYKGKNDEMYGYCNASGKEALKAQYLQAGAFGNEYAAVQDGNGDFYYIDSEGNRKINVTDTIEVTKIGFLSSGRYPIGTEGEMYYADEEGNLVLGPYEDVTSFNGQSAAVKEKGYWYLIDYDGNILSEPYLEIARDEKDLILKNGVIFAETEQGYICLRDNGERINNAFYEDVRCFCDSTYAAVKINGSWGYIDNTGTVQIEPQYDDAKSFTNGLAAVKIDGLWGYIDRNGEIVIEPAFTSANAINEEGCTFVEIESEKWSMLKLIGGV